MDELLQKIDSIFSEHKLLGNYDFTEDEYSLMLENVGVMCHHLFYYGDKFKEQNYKLIFATLVELAKRWKDSNNDDDAEDNNSFWDYISRFLIGEYSISQKLYHSFTDVIYTLGIKHMVPTVFTGQKYYSTLMMHAFAPKDSLFSFFDLCYNIFKKDLDFGFTSDDEWLCKIVAAQMRTVLGGGYREDKKVSIGSSAYSIKIGLRSFSLHKELSIDFVKFIQNTFIQINRLFNKEPLDGNTRLERYIVEWWKNKTESEKVLGYTPRKKRISTVSKESIVAKYIREDDQVFLYIPSIRLEHINSQVWLDIYVEGNLERSEEIRTKHGELVVASKQTELELNEVLSCSKTINIRVEIKENQTVIFDSERIKSTSLNRDFILFEGENEVLGHINKPTNYFVYSKDIDALKSVPSDLSTYGPNLYNIYPRAGETMIGLSRQVFFVDKIDAGSLGNKACLIGRLMDAEWFWEEFSCIVYTKGVKLLIPESANLKALELRIDNNAYSLQELEYEIIECNSYQFGLKVLGLVPECYPTLISLYSYEKERVILTETIIVFPDLEIHFNHPFYYGTIDRKLKVTFGSEVQELTWRNKDSEIRCPLNEGVLLIRVPYLRWRINSNEWHNQPIMRKLWYKDFLSYGDVLEIDYPEEKQDQMLVGIRNGNNFIIDRNQSGKFEIGRAIYANEGTTDFWFFFINGKESYFFFSVATKEYFVSNPLTYKEDKVFWNVEDTFIGDKSNEFFLIIKSAENNFRSKFAFKNSVIDGLKEDICKVQVKIKDQNIFSAKDSYQLIFEGELSIGSPERLRFKNKKIMLLSASCFGSAKLVWTPFRPKYFIDKLEFVQEDENTYYSGHLCIIDQEGKVKDLNFMRNEKGEYEKTNPVRIELRDNSTLWMVAGWEGGADFIGNFFCDKVRKGICNIQRQDEHFGEINLYKFKEDDV